jgi:hypothetical protein
VKTRRSYSTDLSDEEWSILEALVPQAKPAGRPPVPTTRASCSTPSSRWSGEDVLGGFCPTTFHPGRAPTTTSGCGASTVRGRGSTHRTAGANPPEGCSRGHAPRAAIVDSQSVRTTEKGGCEDTTGQREGKRKKAAFAGRYRRVGLEGKGARSGPSRPGGRQGAPRGRGVGGFPPPAAPVGGRRLPRNGPWREWITAELGLSLEIVQRRSRWVWVPNDVEPDPIPLRASR